MIARRIALGALLATPAIARAEARPVRIIVPVAPGGSQDVAARILARGLPEALGGPVVVENLPGAGSNIGYEAGARARPDGHTLIAGSDSLSINGALFPNLSFDPVRDFAAVARAVRVPQILVVRADHPARSLDTLLTGARDGLLNLGTPGNGSLAHLLGETIQAAAGLRWTHVPYRGGSLAVADLLAGTLGAVLINIGAVTEAVRAGRLRGLAVSGTERSPALPDVPTLEEAGLRGATAVGWHGLVAPAATEPAVIRRSNRAVRATLARPEVAERLAALGLEPVDEPPEALAALIRSDAERWGRVIRAARLTPD